MSSRKIKSILLKKGYPVLTVNYIRNAPTPTGYGCGYDIEFVNIDDSFVEIEDIVFDFDKSIPISYFMEFDTLNDVIEWADKLPLITARLE